MSFIGSIFSAIISVVVAIVEVVIQVVEVVVNLIMVLLGWDGGSTQIIEYYEVHNFPLFTNEDLNITLVDTVVNSVRNNTSLISDLIYALSFAELKGDIRKFMQHIEDGNYFEGFPSIESYILIVDYDELTAALATLNGVPCTPEQSSITALSDNTWVKYWLQENKEYNVGTNTMGVDYSTTSTSPITPAADTVTVTPSTNHFDIDITSEIATEDEVFADERWQVNFTNIVYNAVPDNYTVQVYNTANVGSITRTLPYTIPSKPLGIHYISFYYRDSAPSRQYLFVYEVGEGTYSDLDTVENPIDIDGSSLQAMNAIPLRISNSDYSTFGATKAAQIEELCEIVHIDAEGLLDRIMSEPGSQPGDIDNIYVTFGVRMWDTSQTGMSYLYQLCENIYPAQGSTQGDYNNAAPGDEKPVNNIITETQDQKYVFQWSYITYEHTSLVDIDADSGSVENGIYYSDMSKFDADGTLVYNYYVSSGKGTYNVGYKADDLDEVQDFLDGNGVPNPGITTGEATNWLQVTERLVYNNPSPVLQEADGSTSDLIYLTPDLIYENNGSDVLRLVESASEATTVGQSMTYYCCKPSGLDAYTVVAPIAVLKVIDGATGHFRMVKFNLGNKGDLMVPFVHTFIKDLSHREVTKLFMKGAHATVYIAHYEVIVHEGMSFWLALIMIIIIVVVVVVTWGSGTGPVMAAFEAVMTYGITHAIAIAAIKLALWSIVKSMVVNFIVQMIITEVAGDNEELAMVLSIISAVAIASYDWNAYEFLDFGDISWGSALMMSMSNIGTVIDVQTEKIYGAIDDLYKKLDKELEEISELLKEYTDILDAVSSPISIRKELQMSPMHAEYVFATQEMMFSTLPYMAHDQSGLFDANVDQAAYRHA